MTHLTTILRSLAILVLAMCANGLAQESAASRFYLIGNSLTWDTVPERLTGDVQWHVDCGVNLPYIHAQPNKPCVNSSIVWTTALRDKQYDVVSVQPHDGSTLTQDVETISDWMTMQPKAVFVIHSGWARHVPRADEFENSAAPEQMTHSPVYFRALMAELNRMHPKRELRQTLAQNLLAVIAEDIAMNQAPFKSLVELYRDEIHLTDDNGKYLMHNAMRFALGQPFSAAGFEKMDGKIRKYLDGVLALLTLSAADKPLLVQILSIEPTDRTSLIAKLSDKSLQTKLTTLLPAIERAAQLRQSTLSHKAEIQEIGGKLICAPSGPQWLYVASGDMGTEIFDVPAAIDLYNGNNPLKGKGGRNEKVTDDWLKRLASVTSLRRLDLANCAIQGDGLRHIGMLTGLRELNLTLTRMALSRTLSDLFSVG